MSASAPRSLVCGLIGAGIQASLTPAMHEREGAAHGLRYIYQKLDTDQPLRSDATLPQLLAAALLGTPLRFNHCLYFSVIL